MTVALGKLFYCLSNTDPAQFVLEGSLSGESARRVKLDVIYKDSAAGGTNDEGATSISKKATFFLDTVLLHLHPSQ